MKHELSDYNLKKIDDIKDSSTLFSILVSIMKKLRSPDGCAWDIEQNHGTIKRNLIEETYEAVECIENSDFKGLKEELGDLLLQVVFHSQIASENREFDISEVLKGIINKLIRRHPHVFGSEVLKSSGEILANWESIKKKERKENPQKQDSMFSNIPKILPSLHYAYEIQNRASRLGFDWDNLREVFEKIKEEVGEIDSEIDSFKCDGKEIILRNKAGDAGSIRDEIGDVLFSIVNFTRHLGIDCEQCLKQTCRKFIKRFDFMEKYAEENNLDFKKLSLKEKDKLWEIAKKKGL